MRDMACLMCPNSESINPNNQENYQMAGKRQHYVPQFLQRGFLHDPLEEAERTWLHRRGAKPRLVGIRDAGVGEYFYSKLGAVGVASLDLSLIHI